MSVMSSTPLVDTLHQMRQTRVLVEELIADPRQLGPDFAPIHRIDTPDLLPVAATRLGWKATGRGRPGSAVADTLSLLTEAQRLGLVERLDWAFRCHTFDIAVAAGLTGELHLTPEPETFGSPCPPRLAVAFLRGRRVLSVVAELHADAFEHGRPLRPAIEQMRSWGWQFAYGDLCGTPAEALALDLLETIRPVYAHVDVARPPEPAYVAAVRRVGATLLAVGVDRAADLGRARELGAVWGRGAIVGSVTHRPL